MDKFVDDVHRIFKLIFDRNFDGTATVRGKK